MQAPHRSSAHAHAACATAGSISCQAQGRSACVPAPDVQLRDQAGAHIFQQAPAITAQTHIASAGCSRARVSKSKSATLCANALLYNMRNYHIEVLLVPMSYDLHAVFVHQMSVIDTAWCVFAMQAHVGHPLDRRSKRRHHDHRPRIGLLHSARSVQGRAPAVAVCAAGVGFAGSHCGRPRRTA